MRIISWNINGIRAVEKKGEIEQCIEQYTPDILLLQETKAHGEHLLPFEQKYDSYQHFYNSADKKGYAGTAVWVKKKLRASFFTPPLQEAEGRVVQAEIGEWSILGAYMPNGGKSPEAWEEKLVFYRDFLDYIKQLRSEGRKVLFGGDVNCAHEAIDLARPKDNDGKIGFHPLEREALSAWEAEGFLDVFRQKYLDAKEVYSWWSLRTKARERNVGWRIDYFFLDKAQLNQVKKIEYLPEQMGSDHCPLLLDLK